MTTNLSAREVMIIGIAIGKCNLLSRMGGDGFWVDSSLEEMKNLIQKLELIHIEALLAESLNDNNLIIQNPQKSEI